MKSEAARKIPMHLFIEGLKEQPDKQLSNIEKLCIFMAD
jgi:hypothetical protein